MLVRWESAYGWTRHGTGWVAERESSLSRVLAGLLPAPGSWSKPAEVYLKALDHVVASRRGRYATDLAEWNALIVEHLVGSGDESLLDRLAEHRALTGGEGTAVRARLAHLRGEHADG